jgi:hypothetical protein
MMHFLHRKQRLHPPAIFRLFRKSVIDARCLRASPITKEYVGMCKDLQVLLNIQILSVTSFDAFHFHS